ncbi:MAG: hypothetical protein U0Q11_20405 [Vicinamibacterales bacterium]
MRRVLRGLAWAIPGYLVGAFGGGALISALSSNTFDGSVEAAMTGAFVTGPLLAVVAFAVGAIRAGSPSSASPEAHTPGTPSPRN